MASGQTTNYGLNQWASEDPVLRKDFNEDNIKVDESLQAIEKQIPRIVTGTYMGNGEESQTIELGFQPKILMVSIRSGNNQGRIGESGVQIAFPGQDAYMLKITETGFVVSGEWNLGLNSTLDQYNPFRYIAFR